MEAVPPKLYGGTERVVANLTDELVEMGHDVTLFASGDSVTKAKLEAAWPQAMRLDKGVTDYLAPHVMMLETISRRAHEFDILHLHIDYLGYPVLSRSGVPFLATLHGRLDLPALPPLYSMFRDVPVVSISDSQRLPLPEANYVATIYHGLPGELLRAGPGDGGYLAFIGRISPEKAPDAAISIAAKAGMKLKIAAKIDNVDRAYFEEKIEPLLELPHVEFIGEINDAQKSEFLGKAAGLLFPIAWPEPFGIAMIEAMACGTPVIAMRNGSVPEVIDEGVTGYIVESEDEAVAAVKKLAVLDRKQVRRVFDRRFTARRMAEDYLSVYQRLIERDQPKLMAV
ncbi:MAG: glycosyl transferase [Rhodospirillales bacterium]|nr:glycosyl transferase [Rhodospirillales bacterium]